MSLKLFTGSATSGKRLQIVKKIEAVANSDYVMYKISFRCDSRKTFNFDREYL